MKRIKRFSLVAFVCLLLPMLFLLNSKANEKIDDKEKFPKSSMINAEKLIKDIKYLSTDQLKGRETGTKENETARNYVLKRFKESGIKPFNKTYLDEFSFKSRSGKTYNGVNVVGFIKGKDFPEKYIVITAHFDHVGERRGQIYNGADDNASGTAALFAIAKYFNKKKPKHTLIFVGFDAEEKGLRGARHFVEDPPVKLENILLNINMDMISRNDNNELYAVGTRNYPKLKPFLEKVQKTSKIKLLFGHEGPKMDRNNWTFSSDHAAFHRKKIPFIYFGVEDHKDYHKPTDDFENIQPEFYVRAVETIIMAVKSVDKNYKG